MRLLDILILIGAVSVITLIFYPSFILHKRSKITLFERYPKAPKKTTENVQKKLKEIYKDIDYVYSDEIITERSWMDSFIVHGIHKPHLPEHSDHWHRLNSLKKLLGLRPWPVFSPGPRYDEVQTSDEILSDSEPTLPLPSKKLEVENTTIKISSTTFQGNERIYLIKDLYQRNHFWAHSEICAKKFGRKSDGTKLLIVVTTSARNKDARRAIRYTWGHYTTRKDIVLVFMLGRPAANFLDDLLKEDSLFHDLVMSNTPDSNMDATLKTISLLEWVNIYCSNIHAVLKVTDDVFINIPNLMSFITAPHRLVVSKTIWGKLMHKIRPERNQSSLPYFIPVHQFADKVLPDFLLGAGYLLTIDAVQPLFNAALDKPHMRLEDVFVTGILADEVGIHCIDVDNFFNYNVTENICAIKKGFAFNKVQYYQQFHMWQQMHDITIICRNPPRKTRRRKHRNGFIHTLPNEN